MKNILLLGDSIRIGYDKSVRKSLESIANVYFPEDNCRFAPSLALPEQAHPDPVHYYTTIGTETFTKQVLSYAVPALSFSKIPEYQEVLHGKAPVGI